MRALNAVPSQGQLIESSRRLLQAASGSLIAPALRLLSRLFHRLFLNRLAEAHRAGRLAFHGDLAALADPAAFAAHLAPLRQAEWVVYAKRPFAGPEAVLAYLSRYTHRVALGNSRLVALDEHRVTFRWKDYRARGKGVPRQKTMTLAIDEFIRRVLLHVLPNGPHRIRHDSLFASGSTRGIDIVRVRRLLALASPPSDPGASHDRVLRSCLPALRPSPHHP